ncbi:hypothetical protein C3941_04395 [Kaistia algarum]|uniref:glycosyltransferase n=1 Tax=Kaistia algarum TaxID=2083279 RepID=UPI000CE7FAFE|nr:glycosyltransferase family 4 protein [Kaistia algarum]MCX5512542.1 glycosyltransferase family 4 protein [Kaistia algarum]PPE81930.1 hypothetical protein C3941_04395 [Kaistia algarum]
MRVGMFAAALSRFAQLDVIVVPVAGGSTERTPLLQEIGAGLNVIPIADRNETPFVLLSRIHDQQTRIAAFRDYGKPSLASFLSGPVMRDIAGILTVCAPDLVHISRSYLSPCIHALPPETTATVDLDEDDLSAYSSHARLARVHGAGEDADWLLQEGLACVNLISRYGPRFQRAFVASRQELQQLRSRHPALDLELAENAVDVLPPAAACDDGATMTFVGSLSYSPNVEGLLWFAREILPKMRARSSKPFRLLIAGARPPAPVLALGRHPQISVLGYVTNLAGLYQRSTIAIAPLRSGGGTRIKLLEAAAHGVATVATPIAANGLDWKNNRHGWLGASSDGFAEACCEALDNPVERRRRALSAWRWVRKHHARENVIDQISRSLMSIPTGTADLIPMEFRYD